MSAPTVAKKRSPKAAKKPAVEVELDLNAMGPVADDAAGPVEEAGGPVKIGKRGRSGGEARVLHDVFELDGKMYQIADPSVTAVVRYMRDLRRYGQSGALENTVFGMLGEDLLALLSEHPDTSAEDIADVIVAVSKIFWDSPAYTAMARAAGNSSREQGK